MKPRRGTIGFEHYKIQCVIGTLAHERTQKQEICIDLRIDIDIAQAAATDALNDTVNYMLLAELCEKTALEGQYQLLEAYAAAVSDKILQIYSTKKVWIRVSKALAIEAADCAFVELESFKD